MQVKRSISIKGHRTSYTLEAEFHEELERLSAMHGQALATVVATVDARRPADTNLSSALRLFVLGELKADLEKLVAQSEAPTD